MDILTLNKNDGNKEEVEIVMTFKLEQFNNNDYVIYKCKNEYYGAKYIEKNTTTELITNLSKEERDALSKIFDKLHEKGIV